MANYLRSFDYVSAESYIAKIREFNRFEKAKANFAHQPSSSPPSSTATNQTANSTPNPPPSMLLWRNENAQNRRSSSASPPPNTNQPPSPNDNSANRCYNCFQVTNHMARNCPELKRPKYCSICKTEGHSRTECMTPKPNTEPPKPNIEKSVNIAAAASVTPSPSVENKYIKTSFINDTKIPESMIDPGSHICIVRASVAIRASSTIEKCRDRIYGVGQLETGTEVLGKIKAAVTVDKVTVKNVEILIVPDAVIPAPFLIGQNWTESPSVTYLKV
ncbi:uncharacterized protein LOC135847881 [Planococcus citri]|uniref:uncharacterized protein LOC135847881 n=1 Tax=Planococcus citri TaxID=170843 RepID=UPI0031F9C677